MTRLKIFVLSFSGKNYLNLSKEIAFLESNNSLMNISGIQID